MFSREKNNKKKNKERVYNVVHACQLLPGQVLLVLLLVEVEVVKEEVVVVMLVALGFSRRVFWGFLATGCLGLDKTKT